jgi:peptide/nickel transport system permease protein
MVRLLRRLEFFVVTFWAAVSINFLLPRLMPGDPVQQMMNRMKGQISPAARHSLEVMLGLNTKDPLVKQYFEYWGQVFRFDFGSSITYFPDTVTNVISIAIPWTLGLVGVTTVISFVLGTFLGAVAAWRRGGVLDSVLPPVFVVVGALPFFWVGLLFLFIFAVVLGWAPVGFGYDVTLGLSLSWATVGQIVSHAVLPATAIIVTSIGGWILTMRNTMIGVLTEDYVKMARAKGLSSGRIMLQYASRNAILPNLTGFAMSMGFVISGALLVELVFTYPGVGFLLVQAVTGQDYPLMQALFLLITTATLLSVLIADAVTYVLDPRTRVRA